jgi:hypothetical protein
MINETEGSIFRHLDMPAALLQIQRGVFPACPPVLSPSISMQNMFAQFLSRYNAKHAENK